jgi:hypothetical protein
MDAGFGDAFGVLQLTWQPTLGAFAHVVPGRQIHWSLSQGMVALVPGMELQFRTHSFTPKSQYQGNSHGH